MLIKLSTPDDPHNETWINTTAIIAIERNRHSGDTKITLVSGQTYVTRSDDRRVDIIEELARLEQEQR